MTGVNVVKLLVAIVDRGKGARVVETFRGIGLPYASLLMGRGTANSRMLECLGLSETRKDVVLAFADARRAPQAMRAAEERLGLSEPGRGILLCLSLSGLSSRVHQALGGDAGTFEQQEEAMSEQGAGQDESSFDLVLAAVRRGDAETVMEAARPCGATGGTVVHGRRADGGGAGSLLGVEVDPEEDLVAIVCRHADKLPIMRAVGKAAGPSTPSRGVVLSLPLDSVVGLRAQGGAPAPGASETPGQGAQG